MSTRILAIDTTTEACSVALIINGEVCKRFAIVPREHTNYILPMVDSVLKEANITLTSLNAIAFGRGPGSFTGTRISIGIAQGLAFGADLPLLGISTLITLAQGARRQTGANMVLSAINARIGEVYWAQYYFQEDGGYWIGESSETILTLERMEVITRTLTDKWVYAGTGWQANPVLLTTDMPFLSSGKTLLPTAQDMLPLALQFWKNGEAIAVDKVVPSYMQKKTIWKKLSS